MILGQLRIWARPATYAALIRHITLNELNTPKNDLSLLSRFFDLLNSMIHDRKISVDLRWLFDPLNDVVSSWYNSSRNASLTNKLWAMTAARLNCLGRISYSLDQGYCENNLRYFLVWCPWSKKQLVSKTSDFKKWVIFHFISHLTFTWFCFFSFRGLHNCFTQNKQIT